MHKESHTDYLEEKTKGNVRIRLHGFETDKGESYGVEVSAYNDWAAQFKLIFFRSGLTLVEAKTMFEESSAYIGSYDWNSGEFVPQKA